MWLYGFGGYMVSCFFWQSDRHNESQQSCNISRSDQSSNTRVLQKERIAHGRQQKAKGSSAADFTVEQGVFLFLIIGVNVGRFRAGTETDRQCVHNGFRGEEPKCIGQKQKKSCNEQKKAATAPWYSCSQCGQTSIRQEFLSGKCQWIGSSAG